MTEDTTLTISRLIAAPPSAVWNAWSVPGNLAKWWIPAPIECQVVKLDLRPGGAFVTRMREAGAADFRPHVVDTDTFTPRTIRHYTGHVNGCVYGAPRKSWDGATPIKNLYLCGTDQGYLGIVGAMISGITMANRHVLSVAEEGVEPPTRGL